MITTKFSKHLALLVIAAVVGAPASALAQNNKSEESDQAFLSRIERELNTLEARADNVERIVRQKMGMSNVSSTRIGATTTTRPGRTATNPLDGDLRGMQLKLRSMKKKIVKESERMGDQYKSRDEVEFDRGHWEIVVRRFELELIEMERDLRRL